MYGPQPRPEASEYISRDEYKVMENIRIICFLAFLAGCTLMRAGRKSLWASKSSRLGFLDSNINKNRKRFACVFFFIIACHYMASSTGHIIGNHYKNQAAKAMIEVKKNGRVLQETSPEDEIDMEMEKMLQQDFFKFPQQQARVITFEFNHNQSPKEIIGEDEESDDDEEDENV